MHKSIPRYAPIRRGRFLFRMLHWLGLPGLVAIAGCAVNPVTGQTQLSLIPESEEIAIGNEQYLPSQQAQGGLYTVDPELSKYVSEVGQRIAKESDRKLPYEFVVLNNSVPNAWCLPGGKIAVNRGLLLALDNEAELAAVLGHEIVHAAAKHGANAMQRGMLLSGLLMATQITAANSKYADYTNYIVGGAKVGAQLVSQKFSRTDELQADHYGTIYMSRAGYDPEAAVTLQEKFVKLSEGNHPSWLEGLFASHPPSEERVKANEQTVKELPKGGKLDRARYQKEIAYITSKQAAYVEFDHAQTLAAQKQMTQALADVDRAISIEPREPRFYGLKGDILLAQNQYGLATEQFNSALDRDPRYYEYYLGRGIARAKMGRVAEARSDLEHSNQLLPTAIANNELGQLSLAAGNAPLAKQYFQTAMSAKGPIGEYATTAFLKLDIRDNPGNYITAQPIVTEDGRMLAIITNRTSYRVSDVRVQFAATANGQQMHRTVTVNTIAPGQQGTIASGWQFGPTDAVGDLRAGVTSASVR